MSKHTQECRCNFREKMVGDGCEVCNPAKALEYAKGTIATLEKQCDELLELAKLARKELVAFADELKVSSTIGGEWDGTEAEAKEKYDRLMGLAAKLSEKVEATQ